MRRSVRFLIAAAAFVALGGFADPAHNFEVAFPNGWSEPRTDTDGNVQSDAPGAPSTGWCRANSHRMTSLDGGSQETLNAAYPAPLDAATWASVLNLDPAK